VQAEILALLGRLVEQDGTSLLFITHDLAVLAQIVNRIIVLGGGRVLESASTTELLRAPKDPYTRRLLDAARAQTLPLSGNESDGEAGS
jgi:peptide/nickel transport system ATP-binding protein